MLVGDGRVGVGDGHVQNPVREQEGNNKEFENIRDEAKPYRKES